MKDNLVKSLVFITEKLRKAQSEEAVKDVLSRLQKQLSISKSTLKRISDKTPEELVERLKSSEVIILNSPFNSYSDFLNSTASTVLILPVFKHTRLHACLLLETAEPRDWAGDDKNILYACANFIGLALENIELRSSKTFFRLLTEHTGDGIIIVSSGIIVYANDTAKKLLGDAVGKKFLDIVDEDSQEHVQSSHARAVLDNKSNITYSFTALKNGEEKVECNIHVSIVTLDNEAYGISVIRAL